MLLSMRAKCHSIVGTISHAKGKLLNYGHCFEKGSCLKEIFCKKRNFLHKRAAQCYFLCVQNVIQLQVPISHAKGKLVNCRHCFEKGSCPKENFLHKKGFFFCIKGLPNVTFCVWKRSFNCRYQYHTRRENQSTTGIVLKKVHAQKKIFCIKRDFSA